ncbi:MAG: metal ABC transporter substrate-binding protein [Sporichthyaceae bacterium]
MTVRNRLLPVLPVLALALLAGCGGAADTAEPASVPSAPRESAGPRLKVVTTVAPITSIAAAVAGDAATIEGVVPEGTNSHTFEPAPSVAAVLSTADIVFINGLQLEEPTKKLAEANLKPGAKIVELGNEVLPEDDYLFDFSFPREDNRPNPHLWTDPTYAIRYAEVVKAKLTEADSANSATYSTNYEAFRAQATALSEAIKSDQESLPTDQRELLTYHDAYAYFAKTYGWRVIGAVQPGSFEEPTPKELAELIDQIKAQGVKAVFGSEVFPSRALEEIGRATGAHVEDTLRDDDLPGRPGEADHSWAALMRYNYRTIISRLGGTTPKLDALNVAPTAPDTASYPQ